MDHLALLRRLAVEAGASGNPPATVIGLTGEMARLDGWINSAWMEIQTEHSDWKFMRKSTSFTTVDGQAFYTSVQAGIEAGTFGTWMLDSFRCYATAAGYGGEIEMSSGITYDEWRTGYYLGSMKDVRSQPTVVAEAPDMSLCLGPVPASGYTITGDYFRAPSELVLDADEPDMPAQFHMLVVWRALEMYGGYEGAQDAISRGQSKAKQMMAALVAHQMPPMGFAGALA